MDCSIRAWREGMDLGLMDEKGDLYVPIKSNFQSARDVIKDKAGETIELTGTVVKTKGIVYLELADSDKPAVPSSAKKDKDGDNDGD